MSAGHYSGAPSLRRSLFHRGCSGIRRIRGLSAYVQARRDRFGLRTTTRAATATLLAFIRGLRSTIGAVRRLSFLALFRLLALRRLAACLGDRVGNGPRDPLDRADRIVVAGDRPGEAP